MLTDCVLCFPLLSVFVCLLHVCLFFLWLFLLVPGFLKINFVKD